MQTIPAELLEACSNSDQSHLFQFFDRLSSVEQSGLIDQIKSIDFVELRRLFKGDDEPVDWRTLSGKIEPPVAVRLDDERPQYSAAAAHEAGSNALRAGRVAMILVAGGQGTRLGFDQPKGMFPIGPVSNRTLFEMHIHSLRGTMKRFGVSIPLFIMTSPATDAATRQYFNENQRLGLRENELIIFCQGTMPAVDSSTGQVLMDSISSIALSPDGHGGIVQALSKSGSLSLAKSRGIEQFFYAQVDNPLLTACDPTLIGYHVLSSSQITTQVVRKRFATEKVGNVVNADGKTLIIEYSDLPDSLAEQTESDGSLRLWAGNIAIHVFERDFLEDAAAHDDCLPFHRANKIVPYVNEEGEAVRPSHPNAIKFERFVFDLLPRAHRALVVEGSSADVFAPVKNATGSATDTPQTAQAAMVAKHRRWLESAGVKVADDVKVEINPLWALDDRELREKVDRPAEILADTYFA